VIEAVQSARPDAAVAASAAAVDREPPVASVDAASALSAAVATAPTDLLSGDPLNRETALSRVGGDEEMLRDIAGLVKEHIPKWLSSMHESIAKRDCKTLKRLAHTLKSSADNVGASRGYQAAARLEKLADQQNLDEAQAALAELDSEMTRLLPAVALLASAE